MSRLLKRKEWQLVYLLDTTGFAGIYKKRLQSRSATANLLIKSDNCMKKQDRSLLLSWLRFKDRVNCQPA